MLRFNQYDQTIHAAMAAQGIALGRLELIGLALGEGRLVKLGLPRTGPVTSNAYWLIRGFAAHRSEVEDVIEWIRGEAGEIAA
jgi:DNA-binding transcriptional LysR family regulator